MNNEPDSYSEREKNRIRSSMDQAFHAGRKYYLFQLCPEQPGAEIIKRVLPVSARGGRAAEPLPDILPLLGRLCS